MVTVDDYIPCMYNSKPLFASVAKNEIWVSILEKALAKLHGSYSALQFGFTSEAMTDLTGFPTKEYQVPKPTEDDSMGD